MKKNYVIGLFTFLFTVTVWAGEKTKEPFSNAEANFNVVMEKLLGHYIDKKVSKEELYKAATAGMLSSLNAADESWNKLLSPSELKEMETDFTGKVTGIGASIKFDDHTGYGIVLNAMADSPAKKAGLQADDQILSVDGKRFKGKHLLDLINTIRGQVGQSVALRVLRDDKILNLKITREPILWTPVDLERIDAQTDLLSIGFFNEETPRLVQTALEEVNKHGVKKLILDLRDNDGGGFDQAVKVSELFLPMKSTIASTIDRSGLRETFHSEKSILDKEVQIIILTNKGTFCGAELLTAALKENLKVKTVGETTFGKWNAQSIEGLPNNFAVKYTVKDFLSPEGHTFQGQGIKPDLEVGLPKETDIKELRSRLEVAKRLSTDLQLNAAVELIKAM